NGDPITLESTSAPQAVNDLSVQQDSTQAQDPTVAPRPWGAEFKAFVPWNPEPRENAVEPPRPSLGTENSIQNQSANPFESPIESHNPIQVENLAPIAYNPIQVESPVQSQSPIHIEHQVSELKPVAPEPKPVRSAIETLLARAKSPELAGNDLPRWRGWK